jgi:hypothetical protein
MTLSEFVKKYENRFIEYHSYGTGAQFQCVDCVNQYITEVLGLQAIIGTNAQDFPSKASPADYDYILNTPLGVPEAGDIMIFKSADNVGHISIFVEGNTNLFTSFDQNYPTGSPCKKVNHNYRNVLGWLHPKKEPMADTITIPKNTFEELVTKSTKYDEFVNKGFSNVNQVTELCKQKDDEIKNLRNKIKELEALPDGNLYLNKYENEKKAKEDAQKALALANNEKTTLQIKVNSLESEISSLRMALSDLTEEGIDLKQQNEDLEAKLTACENQEPNLEEPILTKIADWIKKILGKLK